MRERIPKAIARMARKARVGQRLVARDTIDPGGVGTTQHGVTQTLVQPITVNRFEPPTAVVSFGNIVRRS